MLKTQKFLRNSRATEFRFDFSSAATFNLQSQSDILWRDPFGWVFTQWTSLNAVQAQSVRQHWKWHFFWGCSSIAPWTEVWMRSWRTKSPWKELFIQVSSRQRTSWASQEASKPWITSADCQSKIVWFMKRTVFVENFSKLWNLHSSSDRTSVQIRSQSQSGISRRNSFS